MDRSFCAQADTQRMLKFFSDSRVTVIFNISFGSASFKI